MGTKIACPSTNGHYYYDILSVHDKLQNSKVGKQASWLAVWIHNDRICWKEDFFTSPSFLNSVVLWITPIFLGLISVDYYLELRTVGY